jgi:cytidine deaminase
MDGGDRYGIDHEAGDQLVAAATVAAGFAYAPYSRFAVGAAVLGGAGIHTGANVENASYGLSLCAERAALAAAVSAGDRELRALAVACVSARPEQGIAGLLPCGACRQWIVELGPTMTVFVRGFGGAVHTFTAAELLPLPFTLRG